MNIEKPKGVKMGRKSLERRIFKQKILKCPLCRSTENKFLNRTAPERVRFECRNCGTVHQYDYSMNCKDHPYAAFAPRKRLFN